MSVIESRTADDFLTEAEAYRRELFAHCYRMMGSTHDAEDLVQETYLRAWRSFHGFEGRASMRTWLHRIATNACLSALEGRSRRPLPTGLGAPPTEPDARLVEQTEVPWLEPVPDSLLEDPHDPASIVAARAGVRLALVAALQHLPPRQRAVLILREVLRWSAAEVAELLDGTVASVNSALQRARATLASVEPGTEDRYEPMDEDQKGLLARYVQAFTSYDIESLVALLHEDATASMPPYQLWLQGRDDIGRWHVGPGHTCKGSVLVPIEANGSPAFAHYRPGPNGHEPFGIQVLELTGDRISKITYFLDTDLFERFGLPPHPPGS